MRVLITGVAGLYGIHLTRALAGCDEVERIIGVDDLSRPFLVQDPFAPVRCPALTAKLEFCQRDFRDIGAADLDDWRLDAIVHLAARVSIDQSMVDPETYFAVNEAGTFRLAQAYLACRSHPILVHASSPEVYGNPRYTPMDIDHPCYPRSVYAVTKLAAEKHMHALWEWHGLPVAVIRNFNTYGPNQNCGAYSAVIPGFIRQALAGEPLTVHGDGRQSRDFLYVEDAARAYMAVIRAGRRLAGATLNIGTGRQVSIGSLARLIRDLVGSESPIVHAPGRQGDLLALAADTTATDAAIGWRPEVPIAEGLTRTIAWYRGALCI